MKLPPSIRLPLITLCGVNACALLAGTARDWPLALLGAIALTVALCWLVRTAYAAGRVDGVVPSRASCTLRDVAIYQRAVRRAWPHRS